MSGAESIRYLVLVVVTAIIVVECKPAPRVMRMFGESAQVACEELLQQLVLEAYPQWKRARHAQCPDRIDDLLEYTDKKDSMDPWGSAFELTCDAHGLVVHSRGEDRLSNTDDDLWRAAR